MTQTLLFRGNHIEGLNGITYHTFRIPAIVRSNPGTLLAFAEGRAQSNLDYGNVNTLYKRSVDNGKTWPALKQAAGVGDRTFGNPTPVVDRATLHALERGEHEPFRRREPRHGCADDDDQPVGPTPRLCDDGQTFTGMDGAASPTDMTDTLLPKTTASGAAWSWDAMCPGAWLYTADARDPRAVPQ